MKERVYKTKISDLRLEATLYDAAFHMQRSGGVNGIMAQIKHIHQHSTYEIFFVLDGMLNVTDEHGSYDYSNCAVIIPPCYNHYTVSNVENGFCLYFSIGQLQKASEGLFSTVEKRLSSGISSFELDEDARFYVSRLAESIGQFGSDENTVHLFSLLFSHLFDKIEAPSLPDKASITQNKYNRYIHMIDDYISNNENSKISLDDLARKLYLCPKQVSRIIRKEYGCSLSELVNRRKLTIACMLLKHTNLSIVQIATTVGYEYENYFFTLFKKMYGVSPAQYREENK